MTTLRRRCAVALVVVLGLGLLVVAGHGTPWRGEWNWTLDHLVGTTVLTGPVVGALAAWLSADERGRALVNDATVRGWLVPVRIAGAATLTGLLGFVIALAGGVIATVTVPHGGPFAAWFLGIVPLLFAAYAGIGSIVGHLWPHRITVVMVAPGLFLLGTAASLGIGPNVLRQGPTTGTLAGTTWNASVVAFQAACLLGVALVAVAVPALVLRSRPTITRLLAAVGVGLAGVGVIGLEAGGDDSLTLSGERPSVCAGSGPRVCLAASHRRSLDPVARQLHRVGAVLADAGATVPETYLEELPGYHGRLDSGLLILPSDANVSRYPLFAATHAIALPAPCPAWSAETAPPEAAFESQELIASWIASRLGKDQPAYSPQAADWLRRTPEAAQRTWVVAAFDHLRACHLDELRLPWDA